MAWNYRQERRVLWVTGVAVGTLVVVQTLAGAANPWTAFSAAARAVHLSLATALLGGLVVMAHTGQSRIVGHQHSQGLHHPYQAEDKLCSC